MATVLFYFGLFVLWLAVCLVIARFCGFNRLSEDE